MSEGQEMEKLEKTGYGSFEGASLPAQPPAEAAEHVSGNPFVKKPPNPSCQQEEKKYLQVSETSFSQAVNPHSYWKILDKPKIYNLVESNAS